MSLRICDITMFYPTVNSGGVKRYILDKKDYALNYTNHVHCRIIPDIVNEKVENGKRDLIYKIKSPPLPWNPSYRLMYSYRQIEQALKDFNPDVIEMGCPYIVPWIVRRIYKNAAKRPVLIGFYHADFPRADIFQLISKRSLGLARIGQRLGEKFAKSVYTKMDYNIVTGPRIKQRLEEIGVGNIHVFPFGVDTQVFKPYAKEPTNLDGPLRLLFVGRLSTEKRILPCVDRIHKLVKHHGINIEFTIIGSGYLKNQLIKKIGNAPYIQRIDFIASKEELARQFSRHDLLLVTNPYETFCIGALESMACGTPVVACNGSSGVETVVSDKTGFLLGTDLDELIPFLKKVDRHELLHMRARVRTHIKQHFNINDCYGRMFEFYESITGYNDNLKKQKMSPLPQATRTCLINSIVTRPSEEPEFETADG